MLEKIKFFLGFKTKYEKWLDKIWFEAVRRHKDTLLTEENYWENSLKIWFYLNYRHNILEIRRRYWAGEKIIFGEQDLDVPALHVGGL